MLYFHLLFAVILADLVLSLYFSLFLSSLPFSSSPFTSLYHYISLSLTCTHTPTLSFFFFSFSSFFPFSCLSPPLFFLFVILNYPFLQSIITPVVHYSDLRGARILSFYGCYAQVIIHHVCGWVCVCMAGDYTSCVWVGVCVSECVCMAGWLTD